MTPKLIAPGRDRLGISWAGRNGGVRPGQEAGDPRNPTRPDAQHVDPDELEPVAFRIAPVPGEGRLPVRPKRHESPSSCEHLLGEEAADVRSATEPGGQGRHGEPGVLGEQRNERRNVGAFPGVHERAHQLASAVRADLIELGPLRLLGHPFAHRLPCTLQSAVHGRRCGVEDPGDFGGRELQHFAQDQHGPLAGRKVLEGSDEGELHAFALQVPGRRIDILGRNGTFVLWPRFEPDRTGHRVPQAVLAPPRRAVIGREDPTRSARDQPQAGVRRDLVQPRAHRAPTLEGTQSSPGAEQRLLQGVLRVLDRAEHPVAMRQSSRR